MCCLFANNLPLNRQNECTYTQIILLFYLQVSQLLEICVPTHLKKNSKLFYGTRNNTFWLDTKQMVARRTSKHNLLFSGDAQNKCSVTKDRKIESSLPADSAALPTTCSSRNLAGSPKGLLVIYEWTTFTASSLLKKSKSPSLPTITKWSDFEILCTFSDGSVDIYGGLMRLWTRRIPIKASFKFSCAWRDHFYSLTRLIVWNEIQREMVTEQDNPAAWT